MKIRLMFLLIFASMFLLVPPAISATWTDIRENDTFSFTGTTVSTSTQHGGHGTTYYRVFGSADISGTADPLGDDDEYDAEMWLEASGKDAAGVPGRGNISTSQDSDEYSTSTGAVGFAQSKVSSVTPTLITPGTHSVTSLAVSTAVITNTTTGRQHLLAVGESIGDFQLTDIAAKNVTLDHNGEEIRLTLSPIFFLNSKRR